MDLGARRGLLRLPLAVTLQAAPRSSLEPLSQTVQVGGRTWSQAWNSYPPQSHFLPAFLPCAPWSRTGWLMRPVQGASSSAAWAVARERPPAKPSRPPQARPGPSKPLQSPPGPSRLPQASPGSSRPLQNPQSLLGPSRPLQVPPIPSRLLQAPPGLGQHGRQGMTSCLRSLLLLSSQPLLVTMPRRVSWGARPHPISEATPTTHSWAMCPPAPRLCWDGSPSSCGRLPALLPAVPGLR